MGATRRRCLLLHEPHNRGRKRAAAVGVKDARCRRASFLGSPSAYVEIERKVQRLKGG